VAKLPAPQPTYPRKTFEFWLPYSSARVCIKYFENEEAYFKNAICWHMYVAQLDVLGPPVSVNIACLPIEFSHVASGWNAFAMLLVTQSAPPPLLLLSRYLWTSKMRLVVVPSGFLTAASAAALPSEMYVPALV
jgi:hypothetical protein